MVVSTNCQSKPSNLIIGAEHKRHLRLFKCPNWLQRDHPFELINAAFLGLFASASQYKNRGS